MKTTTNAPGITQAPAPPVPATSAPATPAVPVPVAAPPVTAAAPAPRPNPFRYAVNAAREKVALAKHKVEELAARIKHSGEEQAELKAQHRRAVDEQEAALQAHDTAIREDQANPQPPPVPPTDGEAVKPETKQATPSGPVVAGE